MACFAMILAAAMAAPGDGPKEASMEVVETLDLSGKWEATCITSEGIVFKAKLNFRRSPSEPAILSLSGTGGFLVRAVKFTDERAGKLRMA
jgi:hypothetical protein